MHEEHYKITIYRRNLANGTWEHYDHYRIHGFESEAKQFANGKVDIVARYVFDKEARQSPGIRYVILRERDQMICGDVTLGVDISLLRNRELKSEPVTVRGYLAGHWSQENRALVSVTPQENEYTLLTVAEARRLAARILIAADTAEQGIATVEVSDRDYLKYGKRRFAVLEKESD